MYIIIYMEKNIKESMVTGSMATRTVPSVDQIVRM